MQKAKELRTYARSNVKNTGNLPSTINPKDLNAAYENWITHILAAYHSSEPAERCSSLDEYLTNNAFFVTGTFHQRKLAHRKHGLGLARTNTSLEMDAFHYLYVSVLRAVLGGHWANKSHSGRLPLAIVAIDHSEAKFGYPGQSEQTNLHWHAIVVGRSVDRVSLGAALHAPSLIDSVKARTLADSIQVEPWDVRKSRGSLGYGIKAHVKSHASPNAGLDDIRIYPHPSTSGLGWGYINKFSRLNPKLKRLEDGIMRESFAEFEYARLYGVEP